MVKVYTGNSANSFTHGFHLCPTARRRWRTRDEAPGYEMLGRLFAVG